MDKARWAFERFIFTFGTVWINPTESSEENKDNKKTPGSSQALGQLAAVQMTS